MMLVMPLLIRRIMPRYAVVGFVFCEFACFVMASTAFAIVSGFQ